MVEPARLLVPTSEGLISPGILIGKNSPCLRAWRTKCTRRWMCRVLLVSRSLLIIAIALLESTKTAIVTGESGFLDLKVLNTCFENILAMMAKEQALYSASALDRATGFGTKDEASTRDPYTYKMYAPVLREVSGQSCHDESVNSSIG